MSEMTGGERAFALAREIFRPGAPDPGPDELKWLRERLTELRGGAGDGTWWVKVLRAGVQWRYLSMAGLVDPDNVDQVVEDALWGLDGIARSDFIDDDGLDQDGWVEALAGEAEALLERTCAGLFGADRR